MLTTVLSVVAISSLLEPDPGRAVKEYFALMLLLETGMLGVFVSLDLFLFYVFWEISLIPMYLLIGIWGGPRRVYAAIKFVLYTLVGSLLMLVAILAVADRALQTRPARFDVRLSSAAVASRSPASCRRRLRRVLPRLRHQGADVPVPHLAARRARRGADRRLGHPGRRPPEDGRLRFHPLRRAAASPTAAKQLFAAHRRRWRWSAILYGALVRMVQRDMKKLVAYSSVSHMGYVILGVVRRSRRWG